MVGVVIDRRAVAQHLARSEHRDPIVGDLVQVDPTRCDALSAGLLTGGLRVERRSPVCPVVALDLPQPGDVVCTQHHNLRLWPTRLAKVERVAAHSCSTSTWPAQLQHLSFRTVSLQAGRGGLRADSTHLYTHASVLKIRALRRVRIGRVERRYTRDRVAPGRKVTRPDVLL